MKSILENAAHIAATAQLNELTVAHTAAKLEESSLLAQLYEQPDSRPSALDRAKAMLTSGTPAPRQDRDGLQIRLSACHERLALLVLAIGEQREAIAALVSAQSAIVNADAKTSHIKAAQDIRTALEGLREAMQAEVALRADIASAGYQCHLQPMARPDLNFDGSQTSISRFLHDVELYLYVNELCASKTVNVRLLFGTGDALPGDVVTMTGHEAAALVRIDHAEVTRDKPARVARPVRESYGQTMATALS